MVKLKKLFKFLIAFVVVGVILIAPASAINLNIYKEYSCAIFFSTFYTSMTGLLYLIFL